MTRRTSRQKLSIIMACYNAARTITESVSSIYRQKLQIPFEVIIINDASTDESAIRIEALRHRHKEIQVIHSANNRGGGASRNAGIAASTGSLLFCLDADDILPDEMLPRLIAYLGESKLDGVIFEESKFFIRSTRFTISAKNPKLLNGQVLKFSDLFASNAFLTQVNFLYTRQAFDTVGGYPILHGFDTQEFGHRFLAQGLKVSICPGSYYFHRQGNGKSYFEREYERGALSLNYYILLESVLYCFQPRIIEKILSFDCFAHSDIAGENLQGFMRTEYARATDEVCSNLTSFEAWQNHYQKSKRAVVTEFVAGCSELHAKKFTSALDHFLWVLVRKPSPLVRYNVFRCIQGIESGSLGQVVLDEYLASITPVRQVSIVSQSLPRKIVRTIWNHSTVLLRRFVYA